MGCPARRKRDRSLRFAGRVRRVDVLPDWSSGTGTYCLAFTSRLLDMARCQLVREPIIEGQAEMVMPSSRATAKIASSTA